MNLVDAVDQSYLQLLADKSRENARLRAEIDLLKYCLNECESGSDGWGEVYFLQGEIVTLENIIEDVRTETKALRKKVLQLTIDLDTVENDYRSRIEKLEVHWAQKVTSEQEKSKIELASQKALFDADKWEPRKIRYHRKKINGGGHTNFEWENLLDDYDHSCAKCGRSGIVLTKDHIVPIRTGGTDRISNIQPLCARCNSKKGSLDTVKYEQA